MTVNEYTTVTLSFLCCWLSRPYDMSIFCTSLRDKNKNASLYISDESYNKKHPLGIIAADVILPIRLELNVLQKANAYF